MKASVNCWHNLFDRYSNKMDVKSRIMVLSSHSKILLCENLSKTVTVFTCCEISDFYVRTEEFLHRIFRFIQHKKHYFAFSFLKG